MKAEQIYLYHLDYELQKLFRLEKAFNKRLIFSCMSSVTKVAYLLCEKSILVPASNYFESDLAFKMLNNIGTFNMNKTGAIKLPSSSYNLEELLAKKEIQHAENFFQTGYHYVDFLKEKRKIFLPGMMIKRNSSASKDIEKIWLREASSTLGNELYNVMGGECIASQLEDKIYQVPEKLGGKAYLSSNIVPILCNDQSIKKKIDNIVNIFITKAYIKSFLDEYNAVCMKDIPLIDANIILPQGREYNHLSYEKYACKLKSTTYKGVKALKYVENCNLDQLFEFKQTDTWKRILEDDIEKIYISGKGRDKEMKQEDRIEIGVITALPKECAAMKKMLANVEEIFFEGSGAGNRFYLGEVQGANGRIHKVVLCDCGMGNNKAAIGATNMLRLFPQMHSVIMTGIAGGMPNQGKADQHVRLGDIVVSTEIIQYDYGKRTSTEYICRSQSTLPSAQLQEAVNIMRVKEYEGIYNWRTYVDQYAEGRFKKPDINTDILHDAQGNEVEHPVDPERDGYSKVHYGNIASANILLKSADVREMLKEKYNTLAIEMEASGIADAAWTSNTGYIVIKGICDYCDEYKNDIWQEYAALVAAAYTRCLIENLPA